MMLRVLGPLDVESPDGPVPVGGPVPRRILTALLVRPGVPLPVERLVAAAWGDDPPPSAERSLISHVTRLREAFRRADPGHPVGLERSNGGYRITLGANAIDATLFEASLADVSRQAPGDAARTLSELLAMWRSPVPFADLADTDYPHAEAARLVELHGAAVGTLATAQLDAGDPVAAAATAQARLHDDPYRERLWELLVLALYRQERQGDALEAYRRADAQLRDGLGVDPGAGLRDLHARVLARDPALLTAAPAGRKPCPYKGLARYEADDTKLFVGREQLVDELVAHLVDERLLVVVGPSGAGKSSLVRAGLVPALAGGALPGSADWTVDVVTPGPDPFATLDSAAADAPDLLVVDQAEEALVSVDGGRITAVGDRVLAAVDAGIRVVLVVRADLFGLLASSPALARGVGRATVLVGPPTEAELRRIVVEPAGRVGLRVEPALADLVVTELRDRPGGLPILSTALVRTWEHRDGDLLSVASYRAGGGVEAALQRSGEDAWARLQNDADRAACRRLLLRLAVDEDGTWVRRWVRRGELVRPDDPAASSALAVLTERRLVVARADDVGVVHEALLTGWPRLRQWLEDGRAHAAVRERLSVAARSWDDEGRRDPAELYRGTRLQAALDTAAATPDDLTPLERAFLDASVDAAERQLADERARADREACGRRRAWLVAVGLAMALAFAASAGGFAINRQRRAAAAAATAEQAALAADARRLGALARSGGDYDQALLLAAQAVALDPSHATESDLFATLLRGNAVRSVLRAPSPVISVAFARDGASVLAHTRSGQTATWPITGGAASRILDTGPTAAYGYEGKNTSLAVAGDGQWVLLTTKSVGVVDPATGRTTTRGPDIGLDLWSMMADGRTVVAAAPGPPSGVAWNWASRPEVLLWSTDAPRTSVRRVSIGAVPQRIVPCGAAVACVLAANEDWTGAEVRRSSERIVRVRVPDGTVVGSVVVPRASRSSAPLDGMVATPNGAQVALTYADGIIRLLDVATGRIAAEFGGATPSAHVLGISPDGRRLAAADFATILVWDLVQPGPPQRLEAHAGQVRSAAWSPDGSVLASGSQDGTVILWDLGGRERFGTLLTDRLGADASTVWATPDSVVAGLRDGRLAFIDAKTGAITTAEGRPHTWPIDSARTGAAGSLLLTTDYTGVTGLWDAQAKRLIDTIALAPAQHPYDPVAWVSPDGSLGASILDKSGPVIIDLQTRRVVRHLPPLPPPDPQFTVAVSGWTPDGRSLLVVRQSSTTTSDVLLIDAISGRVVLRVDTGRDVPVEAAADPSGAYFAIVTETGRLLVVDAKDGRPLAPPLAANDGRVHNVSISPDGRFIATAGIPPRVTVWDTRTFRQVGIPLPLELGAFDARARFAPDGRLVVSNGTAIRAFPVDPAQWLQRACEAAGRVLTEQEWQEYLPDRPYAPACR